MSQRRLEKMGGLLKQAIAEILLLKSKDARLKAVNVTGIKISPDLKKAVVRYSVLGGPEEKAATQKALEKGAGFVRSCLGEILQLKYTPEIKFEFDKNLEYAQHMAEILNNISAESNTNQQQEGEDDKN